MNRDKSRYTPMLQQYLTIKEEHQDAFLFFRLGDFYEFYFEDALLGSKELEIALGHKPLAGTDEKVPMCGVPYHVVDQHIARLVERGYKVAICEQVEEPSQAKGLVKREVVRILTPGTVMLQDALKENENNFIISVHGSNNDYSLAYSDLSTGENYVMTTTAQSLISDLITLDCKEVVVGSEVDFSLFNNLKALKSVVLSVEDAVDVPSTYAHLLKNIKDVAFEKAFGRLMNYLISTQSGSLGHLQLVKQTNADEYVKMDHNTKRNLELTETLRTKTRKGSLLGGLDKTKTAMGSRLLKQWVERPSLKYSVIEERLDIVTSLKANFGLKEELKGLLDDVYDLERLAGRVAFGTANARDLRQLYISLTKVPPIKTALKKLPLTQNSLTALLSSIEDTTELTNLLGRSIAENPSQTIKEGGIIRSGYSEELDTYLDAVEHGTDWMSALETSEREKTDIKALKVKYNKTFGYLIEVNRMHAHVLKNLDGYELKQTLANVERFITPELKEKESLILNAKDNSVQLEYNLFCSIRNDVKAEIPKLQHIAKVLAYVDVLQSLATVSELNNYIRPTLNLENNLDLKLGRHPIVEKALTEGYIANDCVMPEDLSVLLITGPNMSGKSTYMRQLALVAIMAQIGCYVPAAYATLPIFDQIFTRIGAADDLASGHSTFMVEMLEANYALENATRDSLILLDEIGRGTATFDGMALAQSIIEYIHDEIGAKTLFATHYHELTTLEVSHANLENRHVKAEEVEGTLKFHYKVLPGASDKSYGINVAQLANLPKGVIMRAQELLALFEQDKNA